MRKVSQISQPISPLVSLRENTANLQRTVAKSVDLNDVPHYRITSPIQTAREYLAKFNSEFGEPKSSTYVCEEIKRAKLNGASEDEMTKLLEKRQQYQKQVKILRKNMWSQKFSSFEEYTEYLSQYVKDKGTFVNCNETLDLLTSMLQKRGIDSKRVYMHSVDSMGNSTSKAEHVFCVLGLDKNAKISDPATWGKSAVICDPWAKFAKGAKEGLMEYEKLFTLDKTKHNIIFEECQKSFPH